MDREPAPHSHGLHLASRANNTEEILSFQARTADECAVYVGLGQECRRVVGFDAAAVLNYKRVGSRLAAELGDALADKQVRILGLLWRRVQSGSDGPNGFIGDDDFRQ